MVFFYSKLTKTNILINEGKIKNVENFEIKYKDIIENNFVFVKRNANRWTMLYNTIKCIF